MAHSHAQSHTAQTTVDLLSLCAGVKGNEQADRLANTANIIISSGLQLCRAQVLSSLSNILNMDRPEHPSTDRLKERGVEKGSDQRSTMFTYTNIGTVSKAILGRLLREGVQHVWAFQSATKPSFAKTDTELKQ